MRLRVIKSVYTKILILLLAFALCTAGISVTVDAGYLPHTVHGIEE